MITQKMIVEKTNKVFKDRLVASKFLSTSNPLLSGDVVMDYIRNGDQKGMQKVLDVLDEIEKANALKAI